MHFSLINLALKAILFLKHDLIKQQPVEIHTMHPLKQQKVHKSEQNKGGNVPRWVVQTPVVVEAR